MVKHERGWLNGWKSIAAYCGDLAVKTVQNYEKSKGLPVKRIGRKVVALPVDLDLWLKKAGE